MDKFNKNNAGMSLVELIVTIAIASILVGTMSFSVSLAFSKDAARCATILNDTLYSVRMDSMSKPGEYTVEIKDNNAESTSSQYVAIITCKTEKSDGTLDTQEETIYLEGDASDNKVKEITATLNDVPLSGNIAITFDKSKGYVKVGTGTSFSTDGIVEFHIIPVRGNKDAYVSLVTSTGKHTIGTY